MSSLSNREKKQIVRVRDGDCCQYEECDVEDKLIDFGLLEDDPESATLDHIIPRVAGGSNGLRNMQLMHRACNQAKAAIYEGVDYEHTRVA